MPSITSPGIGSGLDIESLVSQLVLFEGQPAQQRLDQREATFQTKLSGLGIFRSAVDNFRSALQPLKDLDGFGGRTVSSSDEELFTVKSTGTIAPGSYDIEVVSLARGQKLASGAFAASDNFVGTGTLEISIDPDSAEGGSFTVDIDDPETATLADIRNAINEADANSGVVASIVNSEDGAHLVLSGTLTGAARTITVTASGGDGGLDAFVYDPDEGTTNMSQTQAALDAELRIDTFTYFSPTNTVTGAIDGLTIDLVSADPGTTSQLTIGLDKDAARSLVTEFVTAYNSLVVTAQGLTKYDPETRAAGALQGDSIVPTMLRRLNREFNQGVTAPFEVPSSLRDLGISVQLDGTLKIDDDQLNEVIDTNFNALGNIFARSNEGVALRFETVFDDYLQTGGLLDVRNDGLNASIEGLNQQRERLDIHLAAVEERLRAQFLSLDTLVSTLNNTSSFLGAQLANLPSPSALVGNKG